MVMPNQVQVAVVFLVVTHVGRISVGFVKVVQVGWLRCIDETMFLEGDDVKEIHLCGGGGGCQRKAFIK